MAGHWSKSSPILGVVGIVTAALTITVFVLQIWNATGPVLTYEWVQEKTSWEWGDSVATNVTIRLRNQG
jgi:hypothetical protein